MCFDPLNKFENDRFVTTEEGFMMFAKIEAGNFLIESPPKMGEFTVIAEDQSHHPSQQPWLVSKCC